VLEHEVRETVAGAAPPGPVAGLLASLAGGQPDVSAFATDAWYAYGADRESEVVPRTVATGRDAIAAAIADDLSLPSHAPEALACVTSVTDCLLEGRLVDRATGGTAATFAWSLQLDESGLIARALTYRCTPVEPSASWAAPAPCAHDARAAVDGYFADLDAARLEEAAAWFSDDVLYSHPPYWPGAPRAEFRGMAELLDGFHKRGPRTNRHEISACLQSGAECLIEGYSHKPEHGTSGQFVSSLTLDGDGRIRRYVALYCEPAVGRRP